MRQLVRVVVAPVYSAEVLEMAATWKDTTKRITLYPAPGQTGVPTSFNRCQEHPTPFGGRCDPARPTQPVGYVITVQADGYHAMKIQGIAATAPLAPKTTYNVRVSGYVQAAKGGKWVQFKTRTWSFATA
jgi:hypothetical protein